MGYTLFINTDTGVKETFNYKEEYFNTMKKKALSRKRYISQLLRSSKNKKRHKMYSLKLHLGTQLLGILTSLFNHKMKHLPWMSLCGRSWQTWFWNVPCPWQQCSVFLSSQGLSLPHPMMEFRTSEG